MKSSFIKPGYLVVGRICESGCTTYNHADRSSSRNEEVLREEWHTKKTVRNLTEQSLLGKTARELESRVNRLGCRVLGIGFLVPMESAALLEQEINYVQKQVQAYNKTAKYTSLECTLAVFTITQSDVRIAAAIYKKTVSLLDEINTAIENGNIRQLRKALKDFPEIMRVLPESVGGKLSKILEQSRQQAKLAVAKIKNLSEDDKKTNTLVKGILKIAKTPVHSARASLIETMDSCETSRVSAMKVPVINLREVE